MKAIKYSDLLHHWALATYNAMSERGYQSITQSSMTALAYAAMIAERWPRETPGLFASAAAYHDPELHALLSGGHSTRVPVRIVTAGPLLFRNAWQLNGWQIVVAAAKTYRYGAEYIRFYDEACELLDRLRLDTPSHCAITNFLLKGIIAGIEPAEIMADLSDEIDDLSVLDEQGAKEARHILQATACSVFSAAVELAQHDHNGYLASVQAWLGTEGDSGQDASALKPQFGLALAN